MTTTSKATCRILADLLAAHGTDTAIVSPGSRNAPILVALANTPSIRLLPVIDERSAAFSALGLAAQTGKPVALVCTSGTALLNYLPAIAEAYYRKVPLIVISADRPGEWIDQDDSQTLRQDGALEPWVKRSWDIPASDDSEGTRWLATRLINDALLEAVNGRQAPVHINIRLDAPLGKTGDYSQEPQPRKIEMIAPRPDISVAESRQIAARIASPHKVMVIAGFNSPDQKLNKALLKLARLPNVTVMAESTANIHGPGIIHQIDAALCAASALAREEQEKLRPQTIITLGGALISRHIKEYLRACEGAEHWHVGLSNTTIDCFKRLTLRVELPPETFFNRLASAMQPLRAQCDYAARWAQIAASGDERGREYAEAAPWSDLKAFSIFMPMIPARWNIQLSNGTSVRYYQLFNTGSAHRCDCNRGVSGIDGCTSTAIGAMTGYKSAPTLLITGDMSAAYDIAALGSPLVTPRLKIIVLCNGGGAIFRFVESTRNLKEREDLFCLPRPLPLTYLARAYGFAYFEADDETSLIKEFGRFAREELRPAILRITTPPETSAEVLRRYFRHS